MAKDVPLLDQISHFQHKLEKYAKNGETDKVLYYIHKLKHLHVTVKHLEETGVGRSVNSLRHNEGLVGEKARDLVNKWKEMVSAEEEEEEEEEEEHEVNEEEFEKQSDCDSGMDLGEQNGEEAEDDEEDDRLQIQEEDGDERNIPEYKPTSANAYIYGGESPGGGNDSSYNPLTSQMDYQLVSGSEPSTREYHPSSIGEHNNSYDSSPEGDQNSGFEEASPNVSSDRRNGNTSSRGSSKKSSKADKERHKKKEKDRDKERHKDSSASHSKEKKKDHKDKHRAKHKDKDKDRDEKKEKNKSHKHKDKERHGEKSRERKNDESLEKSRTEPEKEKKKEMINGYSTSDMEYKAHSIKHSKENNKREEEDKHRDKSGIHRKEERSREKENKEKESSDSEYIRERDTSSREDRNKEKEKHKHREKHGSGKKDKGKHDSKYLENQREISEDSESNTVESKKKSKTSTENDCDFGAALMGFDSPLKKKKKKKKKDRKERESSDDERASSSKSSHKRALSEGGDLPDAKKPRLLEKPPQSLPKLPSSFSDAALESPLLPEINPNYKPLPRVPLRDDRPQVTDKMSEEETFNIMMKSKNTKRGKMYSGRVMGLQSVPTLKQSCIRVMIDYIDAIEYTGNVPYDILKPVLDRATPQQLLNIEDFNPYLLEDTDEIWEVHCRRDFRNQRRDDMESWRDLYLRCFDAREKKLKSLTENLQQKFISKAEPRRQTKLAFVDTVAKVPKSVARAQAKHGTGVPSGSLVKPGKAAEIAARKTAMQNAQRAEKAASAPRPSAAKNKKVAPLMAKTRQFYKKAFRR